MWLCDATVWHEIWLGKGDDADNDEDNKDDNDDSVNKANVLINS